LGTAGGASQYFEQAGRRFSHIIDPRTGWPAENVYSATVLAPTATWADGLATAFFVMSVEAVAEFCAAHPKIGAVLVCPGKQPSEVTIRAWGMLPSDWTPLN
jgi:thiamine biosynthesis lipoprotein